MNTLRGILAASFLALNMAVWCVPLFALGTVRTLVPLAAVHRWLSGAMDVVIDGWVGGNKVMAAALGLFKLELTVALSSPVSLRRKYLVICNHQSWADIIILQNTLRGVVPPLKFFTKRELIWVPLLGVAMWFLGFPYVSRGGGDRQALAQSCRGFKEHPVSILNFLEGTRFTAAKHANRGSDYVHLLPPKTGGLAFVLGELGESIDQVLDVTIAYPGRPPSFWQFLCGTVKQPVAVDIAGLPTPVRSANRTLSAAELHEVKSWAQQRWRAKDSQLDTPLAAR